jgi:hypothetical protein
MTATKALTSDLGFQPIPSLVRLLSLERPPFVSGHVFHFHAQGARLRRSRSTVLNEKFNKTQGRGVSLAFSMLRVRHQTEPSRRPEKLTRNLLCWRLEIDRA